MKKLLFLLCLLSWSALNAQKTINRPPFIAKATETIEIAAVHLSDTATVIDVDAIYSKVLDTYCPCYLSGGR